MSNYICIKGQRIELTEEQVEQIKEAFYQKNRCCGKNAEVKLAEVPAGEVVKVGGYELLVLEQMGESTAVICKDLIGEPSEFGENNNYDGSYADEKCQEFAQALSEVIGWDNIILHKVDLTSDDGLKDYGIVERRASLLTADLYRRYVEVLDIFNPDRWWWLATPYSTPRHEDSNWIKCVSPSGDVNRDFYDDVIGVRPFCILKSDIFVSR